MCDDVVWNIAFSSVKRKVELEIWAVQITPENLVTVCKYIEEELGGWTSRVPKDDGGSTVVISPTKYGAEVEALGSWLVEDDVLGMGWMVVSEDTFRRWYEMVGGGAVK